MGNFGCPLLGFCCKVLGKKVFSSGGGKDKPSSMHPKINILELVLGKSTVHVLWFEVLWTIPGRHKFSTQWKKRPGREKNLR